MPNNSLAKSKSCMQETRREHQTRRQNQTKTHIISLNEFGIINRISDGQEGAAPSKYNFTHKTLQPNSFLDLLKHRMDGEMWSQKTYISPTHSQPTQQHSCRRTTRRMKRILHISLIHVSSKVEQSCNTCHAVVKFMPFPDGDARTRIQLFSRLDGIPKCQTENTNRLSFLTHYLC